MLNSLKNVAPAIINMIEILVPPAHTSIIIFCPAFRSFIKKMAALYCSNPIGCAN